MKDISLFAFDADDTLWECQTYFASVEKEYCDLLKHYAPVEEVSQALFATETANMELLGYGSKAFILSLLENATQVSHGKLTSAEVTAIIKMGKSLLQLPGKPLEGVVTTMEKLRRSGLYRLVVFTKGELLDQESKFNRSGLRTYFDDFIVVSDKTPEAYERLCEQFGIGIEELLMVGNSFKSDVEPVLKLGGWAVHIPFHTIWQHEVVDEYEHPHLLKMRSFSELETLTNEREQRLKVDRLQLRSI